MLREKGQRRFSTFQIILYMDLCTIVKCLFPEFKNIFDCESPKAELNMELTEEQLKAIQLAKQKSAEKKSEIENIFNNSEYSITAHIGISKGSILFPEEIRDKFLEPNHNGNCDDEFQDGNHNRTTAILDCTIYYNDGAEEKDGQDILDIIYPQVFMFLADHFKCDAKLRFNGVEHSVEYK